MPAGAASSRSMSRLDRTARRSGDGVHLTGGRRGIARCRRQATGPCRARGRAFICDVGRAGPECVARRIEPARARSASRRRVATRRFVLRDAHIYEGGVQSDVRAARETNGWSRTENDAAAIMMVVVVDEKSDDVTELAGRRQCIGALGKPILTPQSDLGMRGECMGAPANPNLTPRCGLVARDKCR